MIGINEIMFDNMSTYEDFGLLMTERTIGSAPVKKKMLDVPWRDGLLDYTRSQGRTFYGNRPLTFVFKLINPDDFYTVYSNLAKYLHGQYRRVTIPEDPSFFYYGLCEVSDMEVSKSIGRITVSVDAEPYKYTNEVSQIINVSGSESIIVQSGGLDIVPIFNVESITSSSLTVVSSRNNKSYSLKIGRNRFPDLTVAGETNTMLTFSGTGQIILNYKEAYL